MRGKRAKLRRPFPCLIFVAISHLGVGRCFRPCAENSQTCTNEAGRGGREEEGSKDAPSSVAQSGPSCSEERPEDALLKDPVAASSFEEGVDTDALSQAEAVIADVIRFGEGGGAVGDARFTARPR